MYAVFHPGNGRTFPELGRWRFGILQPAIRAAALESLDPITRKCVDSIGYMTLCMSENIMVERAHYQKIFEVYSKREQTEKQLSQPLLQAINSLQLHGIDGDKLQIGGGT